VNVRPAFSSRARDAVVVRSLLAVIVLSVSLIAAACGSQPEPDEDLALTYEGQPVTASTVERGGTELVRWVTVKDYLEKDEGDRDDFLRLVWKEFAEDHGSNEAIDTPDPRNLDRSEQEACAHGPNGGAYVFWYRETRVGTPMIYAENCPG
jgi:hypothetical protein